jgi:hypothetical protein
MVVLTILQSCISRPNYDDDACIQAFKKNYTKGVAGHWHWAAIVGLAPIPIARLIAYALVALVRWIRAGFKAST